MLTRILPSFVWEIWTQESAMNHALVIAGVLGVSSLLYYSGKNAFLFVVHYCAITVNKTIPAFS